MRGSAIAVLAVFALWACPAFSLPAQDLSAVSVSDQVQYVLEVSDKGGKVLAEVQLEDNRFDLLYVHSFHLTPVAERFRVEKGVDGALMLHLFELEYESSGVGMPADAENGYRLVDGKFILSMDRSFAVIPLMISIVPGHGILSGGVFKPFTGWAPEESALFLAAKAVPSKSVGEVNTQ